MLEMDVSNTIWNIQYCNVDTLAISEQIVNMSGQNQY